MSCQRADLAVPDGDRVSLYLLALAIPRGTRKLEGINWCAVVCSRSKLLDCQREIVAVAAMITNPVGVGTD